MAAEKEEQDEEYCAATKLQNLAKKRKNKRRTAKVFTPAETQRRLDAAVLVQSYIRRRIAENRVTDIKKMKKSAEKIQSLHRGRQDRRKQSAKRLGGRDLDVSDMSKGLSCLGRNPFDLRHAYIHFTCTNSYVRGLGILAERYPMLQKLELGNNLIDDLTPLEALPYLTELHVPTNRVTHVLHFFPKLCDENNRWNTGDGSYGSNLKIANLRDNRITDITDITHHDYLNEIYLDKNSIMEVTGIEGLKHLHVLHLSDNGLERISGLNCLPLVELVLHHNNLQVIENLEELPFLQKLDLSHNMISELSGLTECKQLKYLDVSHNKIQDVIEVDSICTLSLLCSLVLIANPCAHEDSTHHLSVPNFYRAQVIMRLQSLTSLDKILVTAKEKVKATNLRGDENSDVGHREDVFRKYFPGEVFVNYLTPPVL